MIKPFPSSTHTLPLVKAQTNVCGLWCGRVRRYRARGAEPAHSKSSPTSLQDKAQRFWSSAHCLFHTALGSPGSTKILQVFMAVSRDL